MCELWVEGRGDSLPGIIPGCPSQHFPVLCPGATKPQGLSQAWGGGSGLLHLPEQPGVEIPVAEQKMSDNTLGTALPKAADNAFGQE